MPFKYQLQKVLDMMEKRKKALDAEVMLKRAALNAEQDKLGEMSTRKNAAQKGLSASMAAGATADVAASNDYIQLLNLKIEAQTKAVKAAEAALKDAEGRRTELQKEMKKFEQHKEIKLLEWQAVQKKKEAQRTDEMAGTIFRKKRLAADEANAEEEERLERIRRLQALRALQAQREKKR